MTDDDPKYQTEKQKAARAKVRALWRIQDRAQKKLAAMKKDWLQREKEQYKVRKV